MLMARCRHAAANPAWLRKPNPPSDAATVSLPVGDAASMSLPVGKRRCNNSATCTCRACVLARWATYTPAYNARAGMRLDDSNSSRSSDDEAAVEEDSVLTRSNSAPPFCGFTVSSTLDLFEPTSGVGKSLSLEARPLPHGGTEQTLTLDGLKLRVQERLPTAGALPETLLTVSAAAAGRSAPGGEQHYSILYSRRSTDALRDVVTRERSLSVDALAEAHGQPSRISERGDISSAAAALEQAARSYGTSASELVEAVRGLVGPHAPAMGASLAVLCC